MLASRHRVEAGKVLGLIPARGGGKGACQEHSHVVRPATASVHGRMGTSGSRLPRVILSTDDVEIEEWAKGMVRRSLS